MSVDEVIGRTRCLTCVIRVQVTTRATKALVNSPSIARRTRVVAWETLSIIWCVELTTSIASSATCMTIREYEESGGTRST